MANYLFKSQKQIEIYLEKQLKKALDEVGDIAWRRLYDYVETHLYKAQPLPSTYRRTFDYLKSISRSEVIKVNKTFYVEIYFDSQKMRPIVPDYERKTKDSWGKHVSFDWEDVREPLIGWIEYGTENNPYYEHDGIRSIEFVTAFLKKEYGNLMRKALTCKGINLD